MRNLSSPFIYKPYFARKLPLAYMAGLRMEKITHKECIVSIKYGWRNTNPFGSMYFAAQNMGSEMTSGALGAIAIRESKQPVIMWLTKMNSNFIEPARDKVYFECQDGTEIAKVIQQTLQDSKSKRVLCRSVGRLENGSIISEFEYEWWFKKKCSIFKT